MARNKDYLFQQLQMVGASIDWVGNYAGPQVILEASRYMAQASRTLANGKRRPWSNPQEHLRETHALGARAFDSIHAVLNLIKPEFDTDPFAPCDRGCHRLAQVRWVGDQVCFECWADHITSINMQDEYWHSPDDATFVARADPDVIHANVMANVRAIQDAQHEIWETSEDGQQFFAEMRQYFAERERNRPSQGGPAAFDPNTY